MYPILLTNVLFPLIRNTKTLNNLKFQMSESGLVHRRKAKATSEGNDGPKEEERDDSKNDEEEADIDNKGTRLTLMEEVLLLGLKDKEGYTSFWNDCISSGVTHHILYLKWVSPQAST